MRKSLVLLLLLAGCAHMTNSKFIAGPQGKLRVDDGGRGDLLPVVFVHGNGANRTQWRAQLEHLRPTRRAIAFDLRGMGESDVAGNGDYSVAAMTDDVQAVVDALKVPRFVIVGHSYGGAVVASYAARHPERVAGIVYADAAGNVKIPPEAAEKFVAALRADKDRVAENWFAPILKDATPETRAAVMESVHKTSADAFAYALNGMRFIDMRTFLGAYHGPRVAIVAAPLQGESSLNVQFPEVATKKIDGVSHWLMMDKPEEFNRVLDEFLATIHPM